MDEKELFSDAHVVRTLTETLSKKRLREEEAVAARFFTAKELRDCVYADDAVDDDDTAKKSDARLRKELDLHNAMGWIHVDPWLHDVVFGLGGRFAPPRKYRRVAVHADFVMTHHQPPADGGRRALPEAFAQIADCTALADLDERYPHLMAKAVFLSELNAAPVLKSAVMRALSRGRRGLPLVERAALTLARVAQGLRRAALALAQELDLAAILQADARTVAALGRPSALDRALPCCCIVEAHNTSEGDVFYNTAGHALDWREALTDEDRAAHGVVRASEMLAALRDGRTDEAVLQALAAARAVDSTSHALWRACA